MIHQQTHEKALSKREIEHFRGELLHRRSEIIGDMDGLDDERKRLSESGSAGAPSSLAPTHPADAALDDDSEDVAMSISQHERRTVLEIDDAIERIRAGTFGRCEADGEQISRKRLEAIPWARFCKEHAEQQQR